MSDIPDMPPDWLNVRQTTTRPALRVEIMGAVYELKFSEARAFAAKLLYAIDQDPTHADCPYCGATWDCLCSAVTEGHGNKEAQQYVCDQLLVWKARAIRAETIANRVVAAETAMDIIRKATIDRVAGWLELHGQEELAKALRDGTWETVP